MIRAAALALALGAGPVAADSVLSARYADPTTRYGHGILGDAVEWGTLEVETRIGVGKAGAGATERAITWQIVLTDDRVFEDTEPRLWDVTGDGVPEIVTVVSHRELGASLVIYALREGRVAELAATPWIGQSNRWLAPVGAADLDGDGAIEIAYVDRPHLAKELRILRWTGDALVEILRLPGVSNHRIGEDFISGGLRDCGAGPEIVVARGDWSEILAGGLADGTLTLRPVRAGTTQADFAEAMACR